MSGPDRRAHLLCSMIAPSEVSEQLEDAHDGLASAPLESAPLVGETIETANSRRPPLAQAGTGCAAPPKWPAKHYVLGIDWNSQAGSEPNGEAGNSGEVPRPSEDEDFSRRAATGRAPRTPKLEVRRRGDGRRESAWSMSRRCR